MHLYVWRVSIEWQYGKKPHQTDFDVVAYDLLEAAELAASTLSKGTTISGKIYSASHIRHISVVKVEQGSLIDAIAPIRPLPTPPSNVTELELNTRAQNILATLSISTIDQLTSLSRDNLLAARNSGENTVNEIEAELSRFGLYLRPGDDPAEQPEPNSPA